MRWWAKDEYSGSTTTNVVSAAGGSVVGKEQLTKRKSRQNQAWQGSCHPKLPTCTQLAMRHAPCTMQPAQGKNMRFRWLRSVLVDWAGAEDQSGS